MVVTDSSEEIPVPTVEEMVEWANIWVPESAQMSVAEVTIPDDGGLLKYAFRLTITLEPHDVAAFTQENFGKAPDERPLGPDGTTISSNVSEPLGISEAQPEGTVYTGPSRSMDNPPKWKDYRSIVLVGPDFTTVYVGIHSWYR